MNGTNRALCLATGFIVCVVSHSAAAETFRPGSQADGGPWDSPRCDSAPQHPAPPAHRPLYGLVVGNNAPPKHPAGRTQLRYADDDAVRFYEWLARGGATTHLLARFDNDTLRRYRRHALHAEPPTRSSLLAAAKEIQQQVAQDIQAGLRPIVFVTYSGHGERTHDSAFLALEGGTLSRTELLEQVVAPLSGADVHLFIDACHAEAMVSPRGGAPHSPGTFPHERDVETVPLPPQSRVALEQEETLTVTALPQVGVSLAASATAEAHEWARAESGVFTHLVLSGLHGAADINGDLRVEYGELEAFIASANSAVTDPRARPKVLVRAPSQDASAELFDLTRLSDVRWLVGDAGHLGHFHVELASGQRLLDAHMGVGARAALALPCASDARVVSPLGEAFVASSSPMQVRFSALNHASSQDASRGTLDSALRAEWFKNPFDRTYYVGFMDSRGLPPASFGAERDIPGPAWSHLGTPERAENEHGALRLGLWVTAGVSFATAAASGVVALDARGQFHKTELQADSGELSARYQTYGAISIATGALALGASVALWLWPDDSGEKPPEGRGIEVGVRLGPVSSVHMRW